MTNFQEMDSNVPSFIGITMAFHFYCIIKYQWHCVPDSKLAKTMNISEFMLKFRMDKPGSLYIPHVPWQFSESTLKWVEDLFLFFWKPFTGGLEKSQRLSEALVCKAALARNLLPFSGKVVGGRRCTFSLWKDALSFSCGSISGFWGFFGCFFPLQMERKGIGEREIFLFYGSPETSVWFLRITLLAKLMFLVILYWILALGWNMYNVSPWSEFLVSSFKTVKNRLLMKMRIGPLIIKALSGASVII